MTYVLLAYRPDSVLLLSGALQYVRREELKRRYLGDIVCMILRVNAPKASLTMYSDYAVSLEDNHNVDTRTGEEIRQDVIGQIKRRLEQREGGA